MNHQPFRDWLLSEEQLSTDQERSLQEHLQSCESCSGINTAWREVESAMQNLPPAKPAPGFNDRWQARLLKYSARKQKQHGLITIGITVLIVIVLLGVLATQVWSLVQAPGPFMAAWFSQLVYLLSIFYGIQNLINPFSGNVPFFVSIGLFFLLGAISFMSVLWLATVRKLSMARRIV